MIPLSRPLISDDDIAAVARVLRSGMLAQGAEVAAFEAEFSRMVNGRSCVAVNSGTGALHLGMAAAGIGPGDEVIVPAFTFGATANAVALCGATPVFADIVPTTFTVDVASVRAAIGPRTAAVMAVHLYGQPAAMRELVELATRHDLLLVEDAAQAHGARYAGTPVGAIGDVAAFSFYPTKNMTTGEGGMVTARDEEVADKVRVLRNQGMRARYEHEVVGHNMRLTDVAAALGRSQLRRLDGWNRRRAALAKEYDARLRGVDIPAVAPDATHVYHQYTVRARDRDALLRRLADHQIGAAVYYPTPLHRLPPFDTGVSLPAAEAAATDVLSLPVRPDLTSDELDAVVACVNG